MALFLSSTKQLNNKLGAANGIATLNASTKLTDGQIPAVTIGDIFTAASEAAMLALTATKGDICKRTDNGHSYMLTTDSPGTLADWVDIITYASDSDKLGGNAAALYSLIAATETINGNKTFTGTAKFGTVTHNFAPQQIIASNMTLYCHSAGIDTATTKYFNGSEAINTALAFLRDKIVMTGYIVNIQIAPGSWEYANEIIIDYNMKNVNIIGLTAFSAGSGTMNISDANTTITTSADSFTFGGTDRLNIGDKIKCDGQEKFIVSIVSATEATVNSVFSAAKTGESFESIALTGTKLIFNNCNGIILKNSILGKVEGFTMLKKNAGTDKNKNCITIQNNSSIANDSVVNPQISTSLIYCKNMFISAESVSKRWGTGLEVLQNSSFSGEYFLIKYCEYGLVSEENSISELQFFYVDTCDYSYTANLMGCMISLFNVSNNHGVSDFSPAVNTVGNFNSYIFNV